jgi:hypothetical protein
MKRYKDEIGKKYGKLTVISKYDRQNRIIRWLCKCDCGNECIVSGVSLRSGNTKSCGCLVHKHDSSYTRLYGIYRHMKQRCYNENADQYKYYGARGIEICSEWLNDFVVFKKWAYDNGYNDNLSIDRIDKDKNYDPTNCQWITSFANIRKMHRQNKKDGLPPGIYLHNGKRRKKYRAFTHYHQQTKYIGSFDSVDEALQAQTIA